MAVRESLVQRIVFRYHLACLAREELPPLTHERNGEREMGAVRPGKVVNFLRVRTPHRQGRPATGKRTLGRRE